MRVLMKRFVLQLVVLLITGSTYALNTADLLTDPDVQELFSKKCIRLGTSEVLPIPFDVACRVLSQPDLIPALQDEFIQSISQDGTVDFPVIKTAVGEYYYINEKGKRADIVELYREQTDAYSFDYLVLASGKRFFGRYDVIIHLQIVDAGPAGIVYSVSTHAYPHNWATRFSAHKIGPVKTYFKKQVRIISYVAREIGVSLCEKEEFQLELNQREYP